MKPPPDPEALGVLEQRLALASGHTLSVCRVPNGASLVLRHPSGQEQLSIEIAITDAGPLLRAHAAALAVEVDQDINLHCRNFQVEAEQRVEFRAGSELLAKATGEVRMESETGSVRHLANDDVQLRGERVLLNCDPPMAVPDWMSDREPAVAATDGHGGVPHAKVEATSGNPELVAWAQRQKGVEK